MGPDYKALQAILIWIRILISQGTVIYYAPPSIANFSLTEDQLQLDHPPYFTNMAVDNKTGFVYIGADNWIFQLDSNLTLVASTETARNSTPAECDSDENCEPESVPQPPNRNVFLVLNTDFDELVSCSSILRSNDQLYDSACAARNLGNITNLKRNVSTSITNDGSDFPPLAFIAPGVSDATNTSNVLYVMSPGDNSRTIPRLSSRSLHPDDGLQLTFPTARYYPKRCYSGFRSIYGFSFQGFSYFLALDKNCTLKKRVPRLVRVCQRDTSYNSYVDIPIQCIASASGNNYTRPQAAFLGLPGTGLARSLNITVQDHVLFVAFQLHRYHSTAICLYSMSYIDKKFQENIHKFSSTNTSGADHDFCGGNSTAIPFQGDIPIEGEPTMVFAAALHGLLATSSGTFTILFLQSQTKEETELHKYILTGLDTSFVDINNYENYVFDDYPRRLLFDSTGQYLYLMLKNKVSKIPVFSCEHYSFVDCFQDPLCGWCTKSDRCTSKVSCDGSNKTTDEPSGITSWISCAPKDTKKLQKVPENQIFADFRNSIYLDIDVDYPSACYKTIVCNFLNTTWETTSAEAMETDRIRCPLPKGFLEAGVKTVDIHIFFKKRSFVREIQVRPNVTFYDCVQFMYPEDCQNPSFHCSWNAHLQKCVSYTDRVNLSWQLSSSPYSSLADENSIIRYKGGEAVLLDCQVPLQIPLSKVFFFVDDAEQNTTLVVETDPIPGSRQVFAFLTAMYAGDELRCRAQGGPGNRVFGSILVKLEFEVNSKWRDKYARLPSLPFGMDIFCNDNVTCSNRLDEQVVDFAFRLPTIYTILMNPPEIRVQDDDSNHPLKIVALPQTSSMKRARRVVVKIAMDTPPYVIWTHSPGGHLWLTNIKTRSSVVLRKDFGVFDLDLDFESGNRTVFGVSEEDATCIFKWDLNQSHLTKFSVNEPVASIAVGQGNNRGIYFLTRNRNIIQRNIDTDSEFVIFQGQSNSRSLPKSLVGLSWGELVWIEDFFDQISVIQSVWTSSSLGPWWSLPVRSYVAYGLVRGVRYKYGHRGHLFGRECSHINNAIAGNSCGCPWKLSLLNETHCSGKWFHGVSSNTTSASTTSNIKTYDFGNIAGLPREFLLNASQVKLIPRTDFGENPCLVSGNSTGSTDLVCLNWTANIPIAVDSVLYVLPNTNSSDVDIIFIKESCIRILLVERNKTWTLFCDDINSANVLVDTESWLVFWKHRLQKSVYLTDLASLVTREVVKADKFQLQAEVPGRMALDSNAKVLYWIHGLGVWSQSYSKNTSVSNPTSLWNSTVAAPKQLQFHDGFLYWIENNDGVDDDLVIFDIEVSSKQTLVSNSNIGSFAVQADKPTMEFPTMKCNGCSHFCISNQLVPTNQGSSSRKCWCPTEKPILASNGTCHEPNLHVVQATATRHVLNVTNTDILQNVTRKIFTEAPAGTMVFASSGNVQCWLEGSDHQVNCSVVKSDENTTNLFLGFSHTTNPLLSLSSAGNLVVFNSGNKTKKAAFVMANINGEKLEFEPLKEDQRNPFAFDHRRKLAVWCTERELKFHEVGGSHLDSHEASIETDFCEKSAKTCTSLTLDEENGQAYFIYGKKVKRLNYIPKSSTPQVSTLHEMSYSYANSLSFDGNGHLFWAGGFSDFGEFVDMIKIPEKKDEIVASIRVLEAVKNKIVQVQVENKVFRNFTEEVAISEDPCLKSDCKHFCFPENRWALQGTKCYCPTQVPPEGAMNATCEPLYKKKPITNSANGETITKIVENEDDSLLKIIIGSCSGVVVLALVIFGYIIRKRRGTQEEDYKKALTLFLEGDQDSAKMIENPAERSYYVPFSKTIPPEDINLTDAKQLGTGQFGAVFLAKYKEESVAIKVVKHGSDKEQMKEFLKEIKIMAYIGDHAHIVQMYGAEISNLEKGGVLVVLELCPHGDLETFLRKNKSNYSRSNEVAMLAEDDQKSLNFSNLVAWSRQIADGLAYLEEKQVVHGDLATRNALLFDNNVVKVSDFGFSRKTYGKQYTKSNKQTPLPYRWAAPETLDQMVFSTQSDVWSYGVTVWEIFTLGNCPFAQQSWDLTFSTRLREGMRLEKPELATDEIYNRLMMHCWDINPDDRPTFIEVCEFWTHLYGETNSAGPSKPSDARYVIR